MASLMPARHCHRDERGVETFVDQQIHLAALFQPVAERLATMNLRFYYQGMETPWGHLKDLDLADHDVCETILAADKHQLVEGLVVENIFDQIVEAMPPVLPGTLTLDVETIIVDTDRKPDRWHAFVWARRREDGLGRYLSALEKRFRTWLLDFERDAGIFTVREWKNGAMTGERRPLAILMTDLSGNYPKPVQVASAVRDVHRQKLGFWGYLVDNYRDELASRVILPRLLLNHGIQPWFRAVWNLDRILIRGDDIWALEIKHKFPIDRPILTFGINDGELAMLAQAVESGLRCFHAIFAKPLWTRHAGAAHILGDPALKGRTALIGTELDQNRIANMFRGQHGSSPAHTTFSGKGRLRFREIPAAQFAQIGLLSEESGQLSRMLGLALAGGVLEPVTDGWLRELRVR